jgi:hypothetical protein
MTIRKAIWLLIACATVLAVAGIIIFNLSVEFGRGTKDPDWIEFLWAARGFAMILAATIMLIIAAGLWMFRKKRRKSLSR